MITVAWPSAVAEKAEVWRVLDLSGMTNSVRESRNYTKAGYCYLNGKRVLSLKTTVVLGSKFDLELRFPNGKIVRREIKLVQRPYSTRQSRSNSPRDLKYRG